MIQWRLAVLTPYRHRYMATPMKHCPHPSYQSQKHDSKFCKILAYSRGKWRGHQSAHLVKWKH